MADTNYISQITLPDNSQYLIKAASVPLAGVTEADDLKAIEALSGTSGLLKKTATNTWALDTSSYVTSSGVTSITLTQGAGITVSDSGTAITGTGSRTISITDMNTSSGSTTKWLNQKGGWSTPTASDVGAAASTHYHSGSDITSGTISGSYLGVMGSASSTTAGSKGAVPTPAAGDNVKFLCGDGTWKYDSHITAVSRPNSSDKYPVLAINEDSYEYLGGGSYTGTAGTNVTIQPNTGTLNANYFVGNGSGLTNISASAVPTMTGATSSAAGTAGKVPAPAAGDQAKFLRGDGIWTTVAGGDNNAATHTLATTTKYFVTGTTTSTTNTSGDSFDTGVYVTTTAGELSAVRHTWNVSGTDKAYTYYNSTDDSIRFAFV